jgi:hypothetical protein
VEDDLSATKRPQLRNGDQATDVLGRDAREQPPFHRV